jgi:adenylate cyclase
MRNLTMSRPYLRSTILAIITAILGLSIDFLTDFESAQGLGILFNARGMRPPPSEVVIIAMDEKTEERFGIGQNLDLLRSFHGQLIMELHKQHAAFVVFDLQFTASHPDHDPSIAEAMRQAGNVLLADCVQKFELVAGTGAASGLEQCYDENNRNNKPTSSSAIAPTQPELAEGLAVWSKTPPTAGLAQFSLDHAPFYLSYDAHHPTVGEAWIFIDPLANTPTLPVVTWLYYLQHIGALHGIVQPDIPFSDWLAGQRRHCLAAKMQSSAGILDATELGQHIHRVFCREDSHFIDFYGPQQTLRMVSYSDVVDRKIKDLEGKVVFIGKANSSSASGNEDYFLTPFADRSGRMAGVEIMATQFANLLENRSVFPPLPMMIVLMAFAWIVCVLLVVFSGLKGLLASALFSGIYAGLALFGFARYGVWLPLVVPLLIQLPAAWLVSLFWSQRDLLVERKKILNFVSQVSPEWFDYVPAAQERPLPAVIGPAPDRYINGVCLLTDIKDYTIMLEHQPLAQSFDLLKKYYQVLGAPVYSHQGVIANIQSDAMMALWFDLEGDSQRQEACLAALEIQLEVERFNQASSFNPLPTRIGIYEGDMVLGSGRAGEFIFTNPFGNPTNRASRIEGVNKHLGTKILASAAIASGLDRIVYRDVGYFRVVGISEAINLVEIVGLESAVDASIRAMHKHFTLGLEAFQQGLWAEAATHFNGALEQPVTESQMADGPSRFYLNFIRTHQGMPPAGWEGVVTLEGK